MLNEPLTLPLKSERRSNGIFHFSPTSVTP